jgi:type III secretory pathway component EscU
VAPALLEVVPVLVVVVVVVLLAVVPALTFGIRDDVVKPRLTKVESTWLN